ncbi:MAG: oxidoreductase [Burkholderiales bacterium]|jgi:acrylyl-CoA reductase (NADPH)|nr:oxidoreductase [Burkholderiales bacterium]MCA3224442.1 oxidoreductase [Burkholderiales bacterium]MCE2645068.1 oxidoreductase [Burkholderiaceae bacterium]
MRAIYLSKDNEQFSAQLREIGADELAAATAPANVTVAVDYSTVNYKDGLAITNKSPVVRKWPMVPGIDAAGTVVASGDPRYQPGDAVVLNGWGVGETHWGGLAQQAIFKGDWLVRLPTGMTARQAMAIGTAGYTAMLCVMALQDHGVVPGAGEVLVTGATGGVGSVSVALLSQLGYSVVASTGKATEADYLHTLGAVGVIDRAELSAPGKPLQKERWAGVVDSVGSHTLANACAQTRYGGTVAACGLAQGMDLTASVAPFILRGVTLAGVDSVMCPQPRRQQAWQRLAAELDRRKLDAMTREVPLAGALEVAREILAGQVRGRVVVNVNA